MALRMRYHELPDLFVLALAQAEFGCSDRLFHLAWMPRTDNRGGDCRIMEGPGDGDNCSSDVARLADLRQQVGQG